MSQERVERLEALLSRVQENRKRNRTPAGMGLVKPEVARAAPEPVKPVHPSFTQTSAGLMPPVQPAASTASAASPAARPAPVAAQPSPIRSAPPAPPKLQAPARPAIAEPAPAPVARAAAPAAEPRRPAQDRGASPLEKAVADLDLPSGGAKPEARRDAPAAAAPVAAAAAPGAPMAPAIAPEEAFEARVIEPEPMREPARPIAQVVSRHSPPVDATFGAMLKRSLSLRPH